MKIISLSSSTAGSACAISISIKKYFYNNNSITNIFDYLEISLESINQILNISSNEIDIYLRTNNDIYQNKENNNSVLFKNFDKIISHHDLPLNYNTEQYNGFIEKYKRRHNRFLNDLKYEDIIFFIRHGNDNINSIKYFIDTVNNINPNLKFYYINVIDDELNINMINKYELDKLNNYKYINFNKYLENKNYSDDLFYRTIEYNWKIIYDLIYDNLDIDYKNQFNYNI
jgi:hypothetical protein